ncbi:MAG: NYN domain-containing protein [Candidatus Dormibacteria bacterium]|jgi:predicted RNA-binding protein with PIN domain
MGSTELIVDGTNVAWAWPRTRPLLLRNDYAAAQRLLVASALRSPLRPAHEELLFVFDGPPPPSGPSSGGGARIFYPDPGQTADERILELVARAVRGQLGVVVATSDRELQELARQEGATTMGGQRLLAQIDPRSVSLPRRTAGPGEGRRREKPSPSLNDTEEWLRHFTKRRGPRG